MSQAYKVHQSCPGCRLSFSSGSEEPLKSECPSRADCTSQLPCHRGNEVMPCVSSFLSVPSFSWPLAFSLHISPFLLSFSLHSPLEAFGVHCWLKYSVLVNGLNGKVKGQSEVLCSCNWEGFCTWAMLSNSHTYTHAHTERLYQRSSDEFLS